MGRIGVRVSGALVAALLVVAGVVVFPLESVVQPAGAAGSCPPAPSQLDNNGFETPLVTTGTYILVDQSQVPGWSTTAADGKIELWKSGFQGVPAAEGDQFAELNANLVSTLYQDIPTTPGQTLVWALSHRGRQGVDTMNVNAGAPGGAFSTLATVSDGNSAWGRHSGTYVVPAGQTITRFAFESVSSAGGSKSIGNFLDAISFGTPSCLTAEKRVSPTGTRDVFDTLIYTTSVTNEGGSATATATISDTLPAFTFFLPGSIKVNTGSAVINVPDSAYNAGTRTIAVSPQGSSGVAGVIEPGDTIELQFAVALELYLQGTTVTNTSSVTSTDGLGTSATVNTDPVSTPVRTAAELEIRKTATPASSPLLPGGTVNYTLTVSNAGPGTALAILYDRVPDGLTYGTLPPNCGAMTAQSFNCNLGLLAPGDTEVKTFSATVDGGTAPGDYVNEAWVVPVNAYDPYLVDNRDFATVVVSPPSPAALSVNKFAVTPAVEAGGVGAYKVLVTNTGQTATASVTLTDSVPSGFTVVNVFWSAGSCPPPWTTTITCSLGTIAGGATVEIDIVGDTDPGYSAATIDNTASATDGTVSDSGSASITMSRVSELVVNKGTLNEPSLDVPVAYRVNVFNAGPSESQTTTLTDTLPAGVTVLDVTPSVGSCPGPWTTTINCSFGTLAAGDQVTIDYTVQLPSGGTYVNTAVGTTDSTNPNPSGATSQNTVSVASPADLAVTKTVNASSVASGGAVQYTISVTNNGPGPATGVVVRDTADAGIAFVGGSASSGTLAPGADAFWTIGSLAAGATVTATVDASVSGATGRYDNTAFVSGNEPDPDGSNNTSTVGVDVTSNGGGGGGGGNGGGGSSDVSGGGRVRNGSLAFTGNSTLLLIGGAALMLAIGAVVVISARRSHCVRRAS